MTIYEFSSTYFAFEVGAIHTKMPEFLTQVLLFLSKDYFLSVIELAKVNAIAGTSWLEPFKENKLFKPMVAQMVEVGMQTELSTMMDKVNEYLQMEIDESLERFQKVLPEITYSFVGAALILFTVVILVPLVIVYMGGFIDMP